MLVGAGVPLAVAEGVGAGVLDDVGAGLAEFVGRIVRHGCSVIGQVMPARLGNPCE